MEEYVDEFYGAASVQNKTYRKMFGTENLSSGGFETFGEYLKLIDSGRSDSRLVTKAPSGASEGIPVDGGFITPSEYAARVVDKALESEIVRPLATVYPMKSKTLQIPAMELTPHSTALYGNVSMKWTDEGGTVTGTKPAFRSMQLTAHKARIDMNISNELVADSAPSYEELISKIVTNTFAYGLDDVFLNGHGGGQPLGILNSPCLITVGAENGQQSSTIIWENIVNMYSRMHPACVGNSVFLASITTIPQLMTLFFAVGTGGVPVPALREDSGKFYLLGKRVYITEKLPTLGNVGDIMLCDFSQYAIGMRQELRIEKSNSPGWSTDESSWRCIVRLDGQPLWDKVLTLADGSTTVSPFITLASR
jgi:HK97 family phage major capsid protein